MQRTPDKNKTYGSDPNVATLRDRSTTIDKWINVRQKKKRLEEDTDSDSYGSREHIRRKPHCCNAEEVNKSLVYLSKQMETMTSLLNAFKEEQNARFYELKNEINELKKGNEEIEKSVDYLGTKYMDIEKSLKERKDDMLKQENRIKEVMQKNIYLEKYNKALEERIIRLEQKELELDIELQNVEKREEENLIGTVRLIAEELNLKPEEVVKAWRVPGDNNKAPRPVIVSLKSREARAIWLKCRKSNLTNSVIFKNDNNSRIFINEHVTRHIRQLFWSAKYKLKETHKYIWIQNGKVLVKKNEATKKICQICFESDIEEIIKKKGE